MKRSWQESWNAIHLYRTYHLAPVDSMGCSSCAIPSDSPSVNYFIINSVV